MSQGFVSFAEVKQSVTMEALLTRYGLFAALTRKGKNLAGVCPFCKGKSAKQFQVNPVKNAWYCFGCKAGGNVLDFVAKQEGVSVRSAALRLDSWFELGLVEETPRAAPQAACAEPPKAKEEEAPRENPPLAFTLKTLDPHHESLAPLGFSIATIERFGAGYCGKGLLKGRMAIPIHSAQGELVAYAGLAVEEDASPRYLFPPKFHPPLEVFNLNRLSEFAEGDGPLYLTPEIEGVLRLAEVHFVSALGLFDGSLSLAQEKAVKGVLPLFERLVLVGEGFEDRTVARLARLAPVTWAPVLPKGVLVEEPWWDAGGGKAMSANRKTLTLGQVVATPGALHAFAEAEEEYLPYLMRHAGGDWGTVSPEDARANNEALRGGERLLSAYRLRDATKVWIITEADRSSTCILLPEEY